MIKQMYKRNLKELEEKTYPFPDTKVVAMLEDLLEKKVIELPECKRSKEMNRVNDSKYCKYHRVVSHPVTKCFVLKELIMKLAQERKNKLDFEEPAMANTTSVVLEPLDHVALPLLPIMSWLQLPNVKPKVVNADKASYLNDINLIDDPSINGNEGRTLVTLRKVCKPQPQVARAKKEIQKESSHCNTE
ncbi:hypothetical protein ACFX2B_040217 [Malus domestica]